MVGYRNRQARARAAFVAKGGGTPTPTPALIRRVPINAYEAAQVAPHPTLGAVALYVIKGNGPSNGFTAADAGVEPGGWRIQGFGILPSVMSDPVTQAQIVFKGFGSQQIAINVSGVFAGHLHGFGTSLDYTQSSPDYLTGAMMAPEPTASSGRFAWPSGATGTWSDSFTLNADGSISTTATVDVNADPFQAYLDMTIANPSFNRVSLDGGANFINAQDFVLGAFTPASVGTVILRDGTTGFTMTMTDDALNGTPGRNGSIMRRDGDIKIYRDLNPTPAGTLLGKATVNRMIVFGKTDPDPVVVIPPPAQVWDGAINGNSGFQNPSTAGGNGYAPEWRTWDAANKQLVFTRGLTGGHRTLFPLPGGLVEGASYKLTINGATSGSSPSAGVQIGVSVDAVSGGGQTNLTTMSAAVASGATPYTFVARAGQNYLVVNQLNSGGSATDNVFRLSRLGEVTPV